MFGVLALAAGYELELRAERWADGIAAAQRRQAEGGMLPGKKHIGRPAITGSAELAVVRGLIADGKSVTEAARIGVRVASGKCAPLADRPSQGRPA
jgi:DNA invertase Pin-like site-specific DNA recombinase